VLAQGAAVVSNGHVSVPASAVLENRQGGSQGVVENVAQAVVPGPRTTTPTNTRGIAPALLLLLLLTGQAAANEEYQLPRQRDVWPPLLLLVGRVVVRPVTAHWTSGGSAPRDCPWYDAAINRVSHLWAVLLEGVGASRHPLALLRGRS